MLLKVGGGSPTSGLSAGIHWHMNIGNKVTYISGDRQRQKIDWVRMEDQKGNVQEYFAPDSKLTPEQIAAAPKRMMDCVDCHNRPSHIYVPPDRAVDRAMLAGRIDPSIPFIKQQATAAIASDQWTSTPAAEQGIRKTLDDYYRSIHPAYYQAEKKRIDTAINESIAVFKSIRFPEMKVDWRTHPDNIGHFYYPGCFRCHDGEHKTKEGKIISKDCNICHDILGQREAGVAMIEIPDSQFTHPVDLGDLSMYNCADCHKGGVAGE
jgi:hypothetical protein